MVLEIRPAEPGDLPAFRSLFRETWGYVRPQTADSLRFFSDHPRRSAVVFAMDGARCVGSHVLWAKPISVGGSVFVAGESVDVMVAPECRGQGLSVRMGELAEQVMRERGGDILYSLPNEESLPAFVRHLGWTHIGDAENWMLAVRAAGRKIHPLTHWRNARIGAGLPTLDPGVRLVLGRPSDAEFESFQALEKGAGTLVRAPRNRDWLKTRFGGAMRTDMEWVRIQRTGRTVAAACWEGRGRDWVANGAPAGPAMIADLLGSDPDAAQAVAAVLWRCRKVGRRNVGVIGFDRRCRDLLAPMGFGLRRTMPLIVKRLSDDERLETVFQIENWSMLSGAFDSV